MDIDEEVTSLSPSTPRRSSENPDETLSSEIDIHGQNGENSSIHRAGQRDLVESSLHGTEFAGQPVVVIGGSTGAGRPRSYDRESLPLIGPANTGLPPPRTGVRSICGRRKEMEDAVSIVHSFIGPHDSPVTSHFHFFGVYDGHGGAQAAAHCREHLHLALATEMRRVATGLAWLNESEVWDSALKETFLQMDGEVGSRGAVGSSDQVAWSDTVGSTALVAVLSCHHIIVANCGDSRAVLCRGGQPIALSEDHKPERADEMARIEAAGGRVICWNGYRVLGVLAMSRAIGDHFLKPYVIAEPDVTVTRRSNADECLILASDGLWDVVSNQDACTIARSREAQAAASALVHTAHERGSGDNISVVVVDLKNMNRNGS